VNSDVILNFDKTFNDIRIDGPIGANKRTNTYNSISLSASDLTVPDLYTISNAKGTPGNAMYSSEYETNSVYFAFNGSYKKILYLGITGRNDWSSALPKESQSYFYPSINGGLDITNALSIKSDIITYTKLN